MDDRIKEYCGLFGVYGHKAAARLTYLGLYALQHRGEESAGIATFDGTKTCFHKGMGLVADVFNEQRLDELKGEVAVGHVRYSTTGFFSLGFTLSFHLRSTTSYTGHRQASTAWRETSTVLLGSHCHPSWQGDNTLMKLGPGVAMAFCTLVT